ncbi:MAG: hypothetical protein Q9215_000399, partial [Flavoplaca cf. flavocitrina]
TAFQDGINSTAAPLWAGGSGMAMPSLFFRRGAVSVRKRRNMRKRQHMKDLGSWAKRWWRRASYARIRGYCHFRQEEL